MTREEYIYTNEYGYDENKGIWSKHLEKFLTGRIKKSSGYVEVFLKCNDGKQRAFLYHRVMWYLAYGAIPEGMQVNHINEVKTDNRLCNLNLMTPKENTNWGTGIQRRAVKQRNDINRSKAVVAVDKNNNVVYEFASTKEAGRNGFNHSHVAECCRNCYCKLGNYFKGYYWYFKEDWEKINQKR